MEVTKQQTAPLTDMIRGRSGPIVLTTARQLSNVRQWRQQRQEYQRAEEGGRVRRRDRQNKPFVTHLLVWASVSCLKGVCFKMSTASGLSVSLSSFAFISSPLLIPQLFTVLPHIRSSTGSFRHRRPCAWKRTYYSGIWLIFISAVGCPCFSYERPKWLMGKPPVRCLLCM